MLWILAALILAPAMVALVVVGTFLPLWIRVRSTGLPMGFLDMLMMKLRRVDPEQIADCLVQLHKSGIFVKSGELEAHVLAGGDILAVTEALISAHKAGFDVGFPEIAALDLAGRDVVEAVNWRVRPKVVTCPAGNGTINGVCQDGIRLGVRVRVTLRTDLRRLVGGAGEATIVARVGEGIVAAIGRARSHKDILERPEQITEYLLGHGLDSGTCFEIVSVDVADIDVLDNVSAILQSSQAAADKRVARAKAEVRRAAAVAVHQEMQARTVEMHGRVVAARAEVPHAVASGFQEGNVGRPTPFRALVHSRMRWKFRAD